MIGAFEWEGRRERCQFCLRFVFFPFSFFHLKIQHSDFLFTYIFTFLYFIVLRGYIEAIREIEQQLQSETGTVKFDDIVVACGRFCSMPSLILRVFTPNLFKRNGKLVHIYSINIRELIMNHQLFCTFVKSVKVHQWYDQWTPSVGLGWVLKL